MYQARADLGRALKRQNGKTDPKPDRQAHGSPARETQTSKSPLDALASGLVSIGDRVRSKHTRRIP
jgi:hypothetical protein